MKHALALCCPVLWPGIVAAQSKPGPGTLAITRVTVINVAAASAEPDQTVLILKRLMGSARSAAV